MAVRCAVLGDPIEHSLSPVLHRAGYAALGLTGFDYSRQRVPAGSLASYLDSLDPSWLGLSLTMPLKREVMPLATSLSETARLAGAANTLVLRDGSRAADNTDVPGLAAALLERSSGPFRSAVVLGGGATATSAGLALASLGCRSVTFRVRDASRARETAEALARHPDPPSVTVDDLLAPVADEPPDVVVSTIPAAAQTPSLVSHWSSAGVVADVVYDPWPTPLMSAALAAGRPLVTGLDLLAHQAALQFRLFTGHEVPVEVLRAAGAAALGLGTPGPLPVSPGSRGN